MGASSHFWPTPGAKAATGPARRRETAEPPERAPGASGVGRPAYPPPQPYEVHVKRERPPLGHHALERPEGRLGVLRLPHDPQTPHDAMDVRIDGHHVAAKTEQGHAGRDGQASQEAKQDPTEPDHMSDDQDFRVDLDATPARRAPETAREPVVPSNSSPEPVHLWDRGQAGPRNVKATSLPAGGVLRFQC